MARLSGRRSFVKALFAAIGATALTGARRILGGEPSVQVVDSAARSRPPVPHHQLIAQALPQAPAPPAQVAGSTDFFRTSPVRDLLQGPNTRPMLRGFENRLFEHIRTAIGDAQAQRPTHNPYLYERLLADTSRLLDSCLAYRRQYEDIEAAAVRRALEFKLLEDLYPHQSTLQTLLTARTALEKQKEAFQAASEGFGNQNTGFQTLYKRSAETVSVQEDLEKAKLDQLASILERARQHQEALEKRHNTPGHSLHYRGQRDRILPLILEDITEAFQKARAAAAGLQTQLGIVASPFPKLTGDDRDVSFLDSLVLWTRSVARQYEALALEEVEFEKIIPITFPSKGDIDGPGNQKRLRTAKQFEDAMKGNGRMTLDLGPVLPSDALVKHLRVRAVGISMSAAIAANYSTDFPRLTTRTWSCVVIPPAQSDPLQADPNVPIVRRASVLGRVAIFRGETPPDMYSGPGVWNADPRGEWDIIVDRVPNGMDTQAGDWPRYWDLLSDMKLHLRLTGKPSGRPIDWITP